MRFSSALGRLGSLPASVGHSVIYGRRLAGGLMANGGTIPQRALRGGFWVFLSYGGDKALGLIRAVVLARLLQPADFGLMGLAVVATGFLAILTEMGIAPALIHDKQADDEMLDTAWILAAVRGVLLWALTFFSAGWAARFFGAPALETVLRVMAFAFLISGFNNTGLILLQKEMDFRRLTYFNLAASVLSLVAAVALALTLRNVWALVGAVIVQAVAMLAGSFMVHPFRPRLRWRRAHADRLLDYGKYILGSGIVNYLLTQGDNALVGKFLGTGALGLYGMAYNVSNTPTTSITHVVGQVAFPAYAKLQDDLEALREAYLHILKVISLLTVPMIGGLFALAPEIVVTLLGPNWLPMVPAFQVLCIYGLERAVNASIGPLFQAIGKPRVPFYLTLFKLLLLAAIIYPLTMRYGILGTSMAGSGVAIIIAANALIPTTRALHCRVGRILNQMVGPFVGTGAMVAGLITVKWAGWSGNDLLSLLGLIALGVLLYGVVIALVDRPALRDLGRLVRSQLLSS